MSIQISFGTHANQQCNTHTQKKSEILNKIEREANQQKTIRKRKRKIALLMFCL